MRRPNPLKFVTGEISLRTPPSSPYPHCVRLMIKRDKLTIVTVRQRPWWQPWKPKLYPVILAEAPHQTRAGDTIKLEQRGTYLAAVVNDDIIAEYGKKPDNWRGWGIGSAWEMPAGPSAIRNWMSEDDDTVAT